MERRIVDPPSRTEELGVPPSRHVPPAYDNRTTPRRPHLNLVSVFIVALLLLLSACGDGKNHATGARVTSTPTVGSIAPPTVSMATTIPTGPSSTAPPTTPGPGAPECASNQLSISFVGTQGAGGGAGLAEFSIKVVTASGCLMVGYPGVQLLGNGQPLPTRSTRGSGTLTRAGPPQMVALSSTQSGFFTIEYVRLDPQGGACPVVTSVSVIPPDQRQPVSVPTPTTGVPFSPCNGGAITVTPIQAGSAP